MSRPWYYVPGRPLQAEKLIARKRENEARNRQKWEKSANYFGKWNFQNEILNHWNSDKHLKSVKHQQMEYEMKLPFDRKVHENMDDETFKQMNLRIDEAERYMIDFHKLHEEHEEEEKKIEDEQIILVKELENLVELKANIDSREQRWNIKDKKTLYIRFSRDKLRHKTHLILEQLYYYKAMLSCVVGEHVENCLSREELSELHGIIQGGTNMIEMYIDMNSKRNSEFFQLYNEETEARWNIQEEEWLHEEQVWRSLMHKLLNTYFTVIKAKLEENLTSNQDFILRKEESLKEFQTFTDSLKHDPHLNFLLHMDISDFY